MFIIIGGIFLWKSYCIYGEFQSSDEINNWSDENKNYVLFPCDKNEIPADILIVSPHGSSSLFPLLDEFNKGKKAKYADIPNIAIPDKSGIFFFTKHENETVDYNEDITRWDLVENLPLKVPIRTSIGCPYRCKFCDFWFLYPKLFLRSVESIKKEIELIKNRNNLNNKPNILYLTDDNCLYNQQRTKELCGAFIDLKCSIMWSGFMRAASINSDNIDLIKESGLMTSWIGLESGDQSQLERMNKKLDLSAAKTGIELLDKANIAVFLSLIVGFPGENEATIKNTALFLNSLETRMTNYILFPLIISPVSELSLPEYRLKWKIEGIMENWSHYSMNSKKALEYCYKLFEMVTEIPYAYSNENAYFNISLGDSKLKAIFRLRHKLTLNLLKKGSAQEAASLLSEISAGFGFEKKIPSEEFVKQIHI